MNLPVLVCILGTIALSQASTTPHHHRSTLHPKEPSETEKFTFYYEPSSHKLLLTNNRVCYIYHMHESEINTVHTDRGLTAVETKVFGLVSQGTGMDAILASHLPHQVVRHCGSGVSSYYQFIV